MRARQGIGHYFPMRILILFTFLFFAVSASAEIYKYYDADGKVVFSDKKNPAGKEEVVELLPPPVMDPQKPSIRLEKSAPRAAVEDDGPEDLYRELKIVSPSSEASVRSNSGFVTVKIQTDPPLDVGIGDVIRLYLDGEPVAQGASLDISLENLDRGEHRISAELLNSEGEVLLDTPEQRFYLQRASVLFKNRAQ